MIRMKLTMNWLMLLWKNGRINSDIKIYTPPDSIEEIKEIIHEMQFAHIKQFEVMEVDLTETCIEYLNPIELKLHSEKDREVHREIPEESMDEPITNLEEIKEFEFEVVEYLDNSSPHPPLEEPISSRENLDNLDENSAVVPLTCSF
jgi:hypothetical protein